MAITKVVELKMLTADEVVVPQARFVLAGGVVRTVLLDALAEEQIRELIERGVPSTGRILRPADGIEFLEVLPGRFVGSRLWATKLMDMDEAEAFRGHKEVTETP